MKKTVRLEQETFKFVKADDLINNTSHAHVDNDNLICDCARCKKRRRSKNDELQDQNSYRED